MALQEDTLNRILIKSYTAGELCIGDTKHKKSMIIINNQLVMDWPPQSFDDLKLEHLNLLIKHNPSLIILGTGSTHRRPPNDLIAPLIREGIGLEHMSTHAACRTHVALSSEGRDCLTALIIT